MVDWNHGMVENFEGRDQTEPHAEPQETPSVGHKLDDGNLLVPLDPGNDRVLDVDVDEGQVLLGIAEDLCLDQFQDFLRSVGI